MLVYRCLFNITRKLGQKMWLSLQNSQNKLQRCKSSSQGLNEAGEPIRAGSQLTAGVATNKAKSKTRHQGLWPQNKTGSEKLVVCPKSHMSLPNTSYIEFTLGITPKCSVLFTQNMAKIECGHSLDTSCGHFPSHDLSWVMSLFTLPVSTLVVQNSGRLGHFFRVCSLLVFYYNITSLLSVSQIKWCLHQIQLNASTEQKKKHTMTKDTTTSSIQSTKHFFLLHINRIKCLYCSCLTFTSCLQKVDNHIWLKWNRT